MTEDTVIKILLVAIALLPWGMYIILHQPRLFLALYLLLSTKLFGFVPMDISLRIPAIMFFVHCAMILAVVASLFMGRRFSNRLILIFLVCICSLILFGILYPYYLGFSNIKSAVIDGKDMFGYVVLAYLAINFRSFDYDYFSKLFCFIGVVLTAVLIVGYITGYCPPGYTQIWRSNIVQVHYSTYISIAVCLWASSMLKPRINVLNAFLFLFLNTGLLIQGHRSILIATLLVVSLLWLVKAHLSIKYLYIIIGIPLLLSINLMSDGRYFETTVLKPILEIQNSTGSIGSRNILNAERLEYIEDRPLFGYGFIDETSLLGWPIAKLSSSRFSKTLGTVDSGYIDMIVRFGIVGTLLFCLILGAVLFERLRNMRGHSEYQLAMLFFLATFFAVNYTWSVFTYRFGIVCVCVAIYLTHRDYPTGNAASRNSKMFSKHWITR